MLALGCHLFSPSELFSQGEQHFPPAAKPSLLPSASPPLFFQNSPQVQSFYGLSMPIRKGQGCSKRPVRMLDPRFVVFFLF